MEKDSSKKDAKKDSKSQEKHKNKTKEKNDKGKEGQDKAKGKGKKAEEGAKEAAQDKKIEPYGFSTLLIHADDTVEAAADLAPPIHLATTYKEPNLQGLSYVRAHNQTRDRVEEVLGALEGGSALVYSSGSSATLSALYHFKPPKIFINNGYQGTHGVIEQYLKQTGDLESWTKRKQTLTKESEFSKGDLIWLETPKNPTCEIDDIPFFVERAHKAQAFVCVDATFGTPFLIKPLELGADLVMHSATKFLAGHSDVLAGVLVAKDKPRYGDLLRQRISLGFTLGSLENYLLLRSLRSLEVRMVKHCETALTVAKWLEAQSQLTKVWHPSLKSMGESYELARKLLKHPVPILSFEFSTAFEARECCDAVKLIANATSLGGFHTTIDHRMKHDARVPEGLLRLSLGLEDPKDILADLEQAFKAVANAVKKAQDAKKEKA